MYGLPACLLFSSACPPSPIAMAATLVFIPLRRLVVKDLLECEGSGIFYHLIHNPVWILCFCWLMLFGDIIHTTSLAMQLADQISYFLLYSNFIQGNACVLCWGVVFCYILCFLKMCWCFLITRWFVCIPLGPPFWMKKKARCFVFCIPLRSPFGFVLYWFKVCLVE